jgi:hypothetical protein
MLSLYAGLHLDAEGNLFGTTIAGGNTVCNGGCGTVFEVTKLGEDVVLYRFSLTDGSEPFGKLAEDEAGNLYGTTVLIFFIAGLLYLLRFERVDNLGAYRIPPETGILIPSDNNRWSTIRGAWEFTTGCACTIAGTFTRKPPLAM